MAATKQFWKARRPYNRMRSSQTVRLKHIEARHAKVIEEKTAEAEQRRRNVSRELDMFIQVRSRGEAVARELESVCTRNVEIYRDALVRIALARQGQVQIVRAGSNTPFSPFDYTSMRIQAAAVLSQVAA